MEKRRILIVEDDSIIALDVKNQMESLGYSVSGVSSSAEEALEKIQKTNPDLILMDIKLSGSTDGIEAAEVIHDRFEIPVIFLTAYADAETVRKATKVQPFGYVVKPFHETELHANIEMALQKSKLERELRDKEEHLRAILGSTTEGVIACDSNGHITFMNAVAETLTGWKQARVLGKTLSQVITIVNKRPDRAEENLAMKLVDGSVKSSATDDLILISKGGKERHIYRSIAPIKDENGTGSGLVLLIRE